jgi:hypothetical protein
MNDRSSRFALRSTDSGSRTRRWLLACLLVLTPTAGLAETPAAGRIKILSGSVSIIRAGAAVPAHVGQVVLEADALRTGVDGRVGILLQDDTRVSLGPNTEMRLDRFAYAPADGRLALVLRFVRGVAAYVSGRIARLAPDSIRLETPAAVVGVRGTTVGIRIVGGDPPTAK